MALSRDEATQEHAVEAIAELLTIPAIQVSISILIGIFPLSVFYTLLIRC